MDKFLIVDDSKIARRKVKGFLEDMDSHMIHEATDGKDAIEKFEKIKYDYVIMDLEMPNMKGDEASKKMIELNPHINIVLVTSIIDKKELINALKIGVKKILQKPISFKLFEQTISEIKDRK